MLQETSNLDTWKHGKIKYHTNIAVMKTVLWFDDIPNWSYIDSDKKLPPMFLIKTIIILRNSTPVHRSHRNDILNFRLYLICLK